MLKLAYRQLKNKQTTTTKKHNYYQFKKKKHLVSQNISASVQNQRISSVKKIAHRHNKNNYHIVS